MTLVIALGGIALGGFGWGVDRLSRVDRPSPAAEPLVEPLRVEADGAKAVTLADPRTPLYQGAESDASPELPAHARAITSPEAADLGSEDAADLERAARRARASGLLEDAAALFESTLALQEQTLLGPDDPAVARTLRQLGSVYADQGRDV